MSLIKELDEKFTVALKSRKEPDLSVLRMLRAAVKNKSIELKKELDEKEVMAMIKSEIKKRKDAIETYNQGERADLAKIEAAEIKVLEEYLPAQMSEADVRQKIEAYVAGLSDEEKQNFGMVMKGAMAELQGAADGAMVSQIVKDVLS